MRKYVRYLVGALVLLYVLAEPTHAADIVATGFYLVGDAVKSLFIFVTELLGTVDRSRPRIRA